MPARKTLAIAAALMITSSSAFAATIECSKVGLAYDSLFVDGSARIDAIIKQYKALPASATDAQREAIRKKFCMVGGEVVGLYKFIRALANDCSTRGEAMGKVLDVINKQLGLAQEGVKICQ